MLEYLIPSIGTQTPTKKENVNAQAADAKSKPALDQSAGSPPLANGKQRSKSAVDASERPVAAESAAKADAGVQDGLAHSSSSSAEPPTPAREGDRKASAASSSSSSPEPVVAQPNQADMMTTPQKYPEKPNDESSFFEPWLVHTEGPPEPANEEERLKTVHMLQVLDSPADPVLDSICDLVCKVFKTVAAGDVPFTEACSREDRKYRVSLFWGGPRYELTAAPTSVISTCDGVSILDKHRLWYHALGGPRERFEHHRSLSFCGWTLLPSNPEVLVVEDIMADRRFDTSPSIHQTKPEGTPSARFYAGCPLVCSNGHRLGTMCIVDMSPRKFSAEELQILCNFAEMVVRRLEKDHYVQMEKLTNQKLLRALDCFDEGLILLDVAEPKWKILYANECWTEVSGVQGEQIVQKDFWEEFAPAGETLDALQERVKSCISNTYGFAARVQHAESADTLRLRFRAAGREYFGQTAQPVGVPSFVSLGDKKPTLFFAVIVPDQGPMPADITPSSTTTSAPTSPRSSSSESQERVQGSKGVRVVGDSMQTSFAEVQLSILVRASPHGRIFRGLWQDSQVAVKVMELYEAECVRVGKSGTFAPPEMVIGVTLSHPNLVRCYKYAVALHDAADKPHGGPWAEAWLVREWCGHGTLTDAILKGWLQQKNSRSVNPIAVLATAAEVASALRCLHGQGVVHGDLCGDCIWLVDATNARGWVAKVADYGAIHPTTGVSAAHPARERTTHAPPELLEKGVLSKKADIYALGVVIREMLVQQRIYSGLSLPDIKSLITLRKPTPQLPEELPPNIQELVERCMAPDPRERPDAATLHRSLRKLLYRLQKDGAGILDSAMAMEGHDQGEGGWGGLRKLKSTSAACFRPCLPASQ